MIWSERLLLLLISDKRLPISSGWRWNCRTFVRSWELMLNSLVQCSKSTHTFLTVFIFNIQFAHVSVCVYLLILHCGDQMSSYAPKFWNSLLADTREVNSLGTFKSLLKTFYFRIAFTWLFILFLHCLYCIVFKVCCFLCCYVCL